MHFLLATAHFSFSLILVLILSILHLSRLLTTFLCGAFTLFLVLSPINRKQILCFFFFGHSHDVLCTEWVAILFMFFFFFLISISTLLIYSDSRTTKKLLLKRFFNWIPKDRRHICLFTCFISINCFIRINNRSCHHEVTKLH